MASDYHLAIWTLLAVLAVSSTQDIDPSQECCLILKRCNRDYYSKAVRTTSWTEYLVDEDDFVKCVLKLDACNQNKEYLYKYLTGIQDLSYNLDTYFTHCVSSPQDIGPSQECCLILKRCNRDYYSKAVRTTSWTEYRGVIDNFKKCLLKLDGCDRYMDYLYEHILHGIQDLSYNLDTYFTHCDFTTKAPVNASTAKASTTLDPPRQTSTAKASTTLDPPRQTSTAKASTTLDPPRQNTQPSGQAGVRSQIWVLGLILFALTCLTKAVFAWN